MAPVLKAASAKKSGVLAELTPLYIVQYFRYNQIENSYAQLPL